MFDFYDDDPSRMGRILVVKTDEQVVCHDILA
jgi:hypothetical protein